jgi:penicillin-binding protein 1C
MAHHPGKPVLGMRNASMTDCPLRATTWYVPGRSPMKVSELHHRIWIDTRTGRQACPPIDPRFARSEVFELWTSDLLRLFEQAGMPRTPPPGPGDCERSVPGGAPPSISSPLRNATYTLRAARLGTEPVPLAATAEATVRTVHWFVDDAYVGSTRPEAAVAWRPGHSGTYLVRVIDDQGRADARELRIAVVR